jgi:hypothetical protein
VEQGWRARDGSFHATKAAALKHNAEGGAAVGLAKIGARNSAADLELIQRLHDLSCELGANCAGSQADDEASDDDTSDDADKIASGVLANIASENSPLRKALGELAPRIDAALAHIAEQNARIAALEAQPASGGPMINGTRLVSKGRDADPARAFEDHLAKLTADERSLVLMKMSLAQPLGSAPAPLGKRI